MSEANVAKFRSIRNMQLINRSRIIPCINYFAFFLQGAYNPASLENKQMTTRAYVIPLPEPERLIWKLYKATHPMSPTYISVYKFYSTNSVINTRKEWQWTHFVKMLLCIKYMSEYNFFCTYIFSLNQMTWHNWLWMTSIV